VTDLRYGIHTSALCGTTVRQPQRMLTGRNSRALAVAVPTQQHLWHKAPPREGVVGGRGPTTLPLLNLEVGLTWCSLQVCAFAG